MTNEMTNIHPEVTNFLNNAHNMRSELDDALRLIDSQKSIIETQSDQLDGMREMIKEISAKSDYYMRLCVEMRTHFIAMQALTKEAEKCFVSGPYRNNGAISQETLRVQMIADDINHNGLNLEPPTEDEIEDIKSRNEQLAAPVDVKIDTAIQQSAPPTFLTNNERKEKLDAKKGKVNSWGNGK